MGVITERERQKYFAYLNGVADGLNESRNDVNSVLDRIRAEIKRLKRFEIRGEVTPLVNVDKVLEIIDKADRSKEETDKELLIRKVSEDRNDK